MLVLAEGGKQENSDETLLSGTRTSDKPNLLMLPGPGFAPGCPKPCTFCYFSHVQPCRPALRYKSRLLIVKSKLAEVN